MYIIFGSNAAEEVSKTKTVLEVDTIRIMPNNVLAPSYCVLDSVPLTESQIINNSKKIHADLITQYRQQNWQYCINAIKDLKGQWNGELDDFYDNLLERVSNFRVSPPAQDWDYAVIRQVVVPG